MLNTCLGMRLVHICSCVQSYLDCILTLKNGCQKYKRYDKKVWSIAKCKNVIIDIFENE